MASRYPAADFAALSDSPLDSASSEDRIWKVGKKQRAAGIPVALYTQLN